MRKILRLLGSKILFLVIIGCIVAPSITHAAGQQSIGWDQGAQGTIQVTGLGIPPISADSSQGRLSARRAAIVDAYQYLVEAVQDIHVNSETTMENLMVNDVVNIKVSGIIRGAKIIEETQLPDGTYQVRMGINMYGPNSIGEIALNVIKPLETKAFPAPSTDYKPIGVTPSSINTSPFYTGVIIDARGLGLEPTFSPAVNDDSGRSIYGSAYVDTNLAISQGMVDYAPTPELVLAAENGQSRAGILPIIVKAIAVKGNNCNVIISKQDANRILAANQSNGFLNKCAVVLEK